MVFASSPAVVATFAKAKRGAALAAPDDCARAGTRSDPRIRPTHMARVWARLIGPTLPVSRGTEPTAALRPTERGPRRGPRSAAGPGRAGSEPGHPPGPGAPL